MSDENNKRYIGEVFIDGKSDKLLQEFLTNLFNSYNGPGKGFNADMVDDWHLEQILDYIDDGLSKKLDSITIGTTVFTVYDSYKFLQLTDIVYNDFVNSIEPAPWVVEIKEDSKKDFDHQVYKRGGSSLFDEQGGYLASDIILDIYYVLDGKKFDTLDFYDFYTNDYGPIKQGHLDLRREFDDFKAPFEYVLKDVEIIDKDGNPTVVKMLDAQLLNGFKIIPITQAAYDDLPLEQKEYWRFIYIIMDEVPKDYMDPITFELFKEVKFVYNPDTQYIDYYDGISVNPRPLISLAELVRNINFTQQFSDFLSETTDYHINPIALKESLKEIVLNASDLEDLDFLTKSEASVLASNIITNKGTITSTKNDKFTTFDISNAFDNKFNSLSNSIAECRDYVDYVDNDTRTYVMNTYPTKDAVSSALETLNLNLVSVNQKLSNRLANLEKTVHKSSLRILIGRYSDKQGEYGTQIEVPYTHDGIYARVVSDDPNFDYKKVIIYIEFKGRVYTFKHDSTETNRKVTEEIVDGQKTAVTNRLAVERPETEKGTTYFISAIARHVSDEYYPASTLKKMTIVN